MQVLLKVEQPRRVTVEPVTQERAEDESGRIDQRAFDRPEQGSVHNGQCVGHRKRRRGDQAKDRDGHGVGQRANRPDFVRHARLMANYPKCEQERGGQEREGG